MGRGDGSGRLVSPEGADDSGTGILHVDMDAFYAAVEVLHDPSLRGRPVIVGSPEGRSVVSSASYEARRYGVRSAMPVSQALRLCPQAVTVPPRFDRYRESSAQVMAIFREITPLVEPLSIDEAFLDVRGARRLWGAPGRIAVMLRERVRAQTGLACSVGVAATKHVAKIASAASKPDGLLIVPGAQTLDFLAPLSVRAVWGIGPRAAELLESRAIRTIGDIRQGTPSALERLLGKAGGERIWQLAHGIDPRPVTTHRAEKSIGHEETFADDVDDEEVLRVELLKLSDRVARRLRASGLQAATVAIKVRFDDFTTVARSRTLPEPSDVGTRIGEEARALLASLRRTRPVRLIGVRAENLVAGGASAALWDDDEDLRRLEGALDDASARFGSRAVTRAAFVTRTGPRPRPGDSP